MRKKLLTTTMTILYFVSLIGQNSLDTNQEKISFSDVDSIVVIISNAEKWFKEVYVENYFDDPYSYKTAGIKALPVTNSDFITNEIEKIQFFMDTCRLSRNDRNLESLRHVDSMLLVSSEKIKYLKREIDIATNGIIKYDLNKNLGIVERYYNGMRHVKYMIVTYLQAVDAKEELARILENMDEEMASQIIYYDIRLDCYSKNKIGNEVLGRFSFPFTKNGFYGNDITDVKQLNK